MAMRPRNFRVMIAAIGFAGALAACNLIAGLGEDFVVDPDAAGGPVTPTEGGTDGQADAATDGPPTTDAPTDRFVPDAAVLLFCDLADTGTNGNGFCDDFESDAGPPEFGWTSVLIERDASVRVSPKVGVGGSRGLDVYLSQPTGGSSNVWLAKTLTTAVSDTRVELEFEFNVASPVTIFSAGLGMLTFPAGGSPKEFGISTYMNASVISQLGTIDAQQKAISPNKWYRTLVVLDRPNTGALFSETVTVDGTVVDTVSNITPAGSTEIRLGLFSTAGSTGSMRVRFDHVVVRSWP